MKYKAFQECCGDGNVHVREITGRSSQTRVTRTACIDNKGHNSHDTQHPGGPWRNAVFMAWPQGLYPIQPQPRKCVSGKSCTHVPASLQLLTMPSLFPSPQQEKRCILSAMTNRLLEHERLFYEEAKGSNSHSYFSMFPPHGLNSSSLATEQTGTVIWVIRFWIGFFFFFF